VWTKQFIDGNFNTALAIHAEDIDGDGHIDVVGTSDGADLISWWRNDGNVPITWTEEVIASGFDGAWPVYAADLDEDNDMDVLGGATAGDDVMWYESDLTGTRETGDMNANLHGIPTIINGPLVIPHGSSWILYTITGRKVVPAELVAGIYFLEIDGRIAAKLIKPR
jgi:hypothetical protein